MKSLDDKVAEKKSFIIFYQMIIWVPLFYKLLLKRQNLRLQSIIMAIYQQNFWGKKHEHEQE